MSKYGSIVTLLRVTAYILSFIHNLKSQVRTSSPRKGQLSVEEIDALEQLCFNYLQASTSKNKKFKQMKTPLDLFEMVMVYFDA